MRDGKYSARLRAQVVELDSDAMRRLDGTLLSASTDLQDAAKGGEAVDITTLGALLVKALVRHYPKFGKSVVLRGPPLDGGGVVEDPAFFVFDPLYPSLGGNVPYFKHSGNRGSPIAELGATRSRLSMLGSLRREVSRREALVHTFLADNCQVVVDCVSLSR
jgi:hypothetical protein